MPTDAPIDQYVKIMADYSSEGVWDRDGCMLDRDELPISAALAARHEAWCERYEYSDLWKPEIERRPFDEAAHATEGMEIAKAFKAELPDWTVFYLNDEQLGRRIKEDAEAYKSKHPEATDKEAYDLSPKREDSTSYLIEVTLDMIG